jgi:hypothetical protein
VVGWEEARTAARELHYAAFPTKSRRPDLLLVDDAPKPKAKKKQLGRSEADMAAATPEPPAPPAPRAPTDPVGIDAVETTTDWTEAELETYRQFQTQLRLHGANGHALELLRQITVFTGCLPWDENHLDELLAELHERAFDHPAPPRLVHRDPDWQDHPRAPLDALKLL